jgi:hypothetical protein
MLTTLAMYYEGNQKREILRRGFELSTRAGDIRSIALNTSITVGFFEDEMGDEAADALEAQAVRSFLNAGDPSLAMMVIQRHSWRKWSKRKFHEGIKFLDNSLGLYRNRINDFVLKRGIIDPFNMYLAMGDLESAQRYAETLCQFDLAKVAFWRGEPEQARPEMENVLKVSREIEK